MGRLSCAGLYVVAGLVLLSVLLTAAPTDALRPAVQTPTAGRPTRADMVKEIKVATDAVKKIPGYKRVATLIQVGLPGAPKKYDITLLAGGTLLAGNDDASKALLKKIDVMKPKDLDRLFAMLQLMTLRGRLNETGLRPKPKVNFPTTLPGKPLMKMTARNAVNITFGVPGSLPSTWVTILRPRLYVGKYFTVHGVNYFII